jgi:hypothetical protein
MKQKDIALIIVVAVISVVFSLVVSNLIFGSSSKRVQKAEKADAISADFKAPDQRYFNETSVDPTAIIRIGNGSNNSPFDQTE